MGQAVFSPTDFERSTPFCALYSTLTFEAEEQSDLVLIR